MTCGIDFINAVRVYEYIKKTEEYNVIIGPCKRKGKCFDLGKGPKLLTLPSGHLKESTAFVFSHITSNAKCPVFTAFAFSYHRTVDFAGLVCSVDKELRGAIKALGAKNMVSSCDWWA